MSNRFVSWYRLVIGICLLGILWSYWAAAQQSTTNTPSARIPLGTNPAAVAKPLTDAFDKTALSFGLDRSDFLRNKSFIGLPLWQYLASGLYLILAFLVAKMLDAIALVWLKRWANTTQTRLDDLLLQLLHGPIKIVAFVILIHLGLSVFDWPDAVELLLSRALVIVVAVSLTYMALKLVDISMEHWIARQSKEEDKAFDQLLMPVINKSFKVFVVILSVLFTTSNLGVNVTGIIASLSIGGLAIGLAAQDTLANLFGAVAIFLDKPFKLGDRVQLEGIDGNVESIGLRSTRIRNLEGHLITVPNKTMGSSIITNVSRRPNIKTIMNLGLTYDTNGPQLREALGILDTIYRPHPKTFDVLITFNQFADSSLNIQIVHWYNDLDYKAYLATMQEMNLAVKDAFDKAGIEIAFPSRTVYIRREDEVRLA